MKFAIQALIIIARALALGLFMAGNLVTSVMNWSAFPPSGNPYSTVQYSTVQYSTELSL